MEMQYFKTDKNGTKYYYDWTCPRCGGEGHSTKWCYTGETCWECNGTGKRTVAKIVKVYTDEYRAKLDARAKAKRDAKEAELKAAGYEKIMGRYGFGENGVGYVYAGNTYAIKDNLKAHGARWCWTLYRWISKERIADYRCVEIKASEVFDFFGCNGWDLSNPKLEEWAEAHKEELE